MQVLYLLDQSERSVIVASGRCTDLRTSVVEHQTLDLSERVVLRLAAECTAGLLAVQSVLPLDVLASRYPQRS